MKANEIASLLSSRGGRLEPAAVDILRDVWMARGGTAYRTGELNLLFSFQMPGHWLLESLPCTAEFSFECIEAFPIVCMISVCRRGIVVLTEGRGLCHYTVRCNDKLTDLML
jgi:hypothetical protein